MSTSWGIRLYVAGFWASLKLMIGWATEGPDIGWVEAAVAIELAVAWLTQGGHHDTSSKVYCDNTSVIASFWKGHLRNPAHKKCLCRVSSALLALKLCVDPTYVRSLANKSNPMSHGVLGAPELHLMPCIILSIKKLPQLMHHYLPSHL